MTKNTTKAVAPTLTDFDAADHLDSSETIAAYLSEVFAGGNLEEINMALGTVARANVMSALAS